SEHAVVVEQRVREQRVRAGVIGIFPEREAQVLDRGLGVAGVEEAAGRLEADLGGAGLHDQARIQMNRRVSVWEKIARRSRYPAPTIGAAFMALPPNVS